MSRQWQVCEAALVDHMRYAVALVEHVTHWALVVSVIWVGIGGSRLESFEARKCGGDIHCVATLSY